MNNTISEPTPEVEQFSLFPEIKGHMVRSEVRSVSGPDAAASAAQIRYCRFLGYKGQVTTRGEAGYIINTLKGKKR